MWACCHSNHEPLRWEPRACPCLASRSPACLRVRPRAAAAGELGRSEVCSEWTEPSGCDRGEAGKACFRAPPLAGRPSWGGEPRYEGHTTN